jgi:hypothetical protein
MKGPLRITCIYWLGVGENLEVSHKGITILESHGVTVVHDVKGYRTVLTLPLGSGYDPYDRTGFGEMRGYSLPDGYQFKTRHNFQDGLDGVILPELQSKDRTPKRPKILKR